MKGDKNTVKDNDITEVTITLTPKEIQDLRTIYPQITNGNPDELEKHLPGFCNLLIHLTIDQLKGKC